MNKLRVVWLLGLFSLMPVLYLFLIAPTTFFFIAPFLFLTLVHDVLSRKELTQQNRDFIRSIQEIKKIEVEKGVKNG